MEETCLTTAMMDQSTYELVARAKQRNSELYEWIKDDPTAAAIWDTIKQLGLYNEVRKLLNR